MMRNLDLSHPSVLQDSLVVSASAGSGKTYTLSVLVCAALGKGEARPFEILATTFSEAAAADLRERLLRPLDLLSNLDPEAWKALLPSLGEDPRSALKALNLPSRLAKSCEEVATAASLWCDPAPDWAATATKAQAFWRRTRREAEMLRVSTLHGLALGLLRQGEEAPDEILDSAHPALLRLLRQAFREVLERDDALAFAARQLLQWAERSWEAISGGFDGHRDALGHLEGEAPEALRAFLETALEAAERAFAPFSEKPERAFGPKKADMNPKRMAKLRPLSPFGGDLEHGLERRLRWAQAQSEALWSASKGPEKYWSAELVEAAAFLEPVSDAWEQLLKALLLQGLRRFEQLKNQRGFATFGDMVRQAMEGLRSGHLAPPKPRLLLVDEYQDTSRVQDAFLEELGAGRTVRVGDLKQSIYGFRGGDPEQLANRLKAAGDRAFRLPANFRSAPPVVDLANRYVGELWPKLDPTAGALDGDQEAREAGRWPIGFVRHEIEGSGTDLPALAPWIEGFSQEAGWNAALGTAGNGKRRRALLLRQRTKLPRLLQILKRHGVQPYVISSGGFWESPGVRLLMAALQAVAHPDQPIACAALLRMVLGLNDAELSALALSGKGLPGLGELDPERFAEHRAEVIWLKELMSLSAQVMAGQLLSNGVILARIAELEAHGTMEPLRARRNLAGFLALLLDLPASIGAAYAALDELRSGQEKGDVPGDPGDADLVIQTVHASKGLEYEDVILPLLHARPRSFQKGTLHTDRRNGNLLLAWKLGQHPGAAYRHLKPEVEARQRRDDLNLLYVALTRARERMALLVQAPENVKLDDPAAMNTWAQWGLALELLHPEFQRLEKAPEVPESRHDASPLLESAAGLEPLRKTTPEEIEVVAGSPLESARRKQEGEAMHAFVRDLLIRWEDAEAFHACLEKAPPVKDAKAKALAFLQGFEARGWRNLRRRTEFPLEGAAASGAVGRADLVIWERDCIHLVDLKHSSRFGPHELEVYGAQLSRYAQVLEARYGLPVEAWLAALKSGDWVPVPIR